MSLNVAVNSFLQIELYNNFKAYLSNHISGVILTTHQNRVKKLIFSIQYQKTYMLDIIVIVTLLVLCHQ